MRPDQCGTGGRTLTPGDLAEIETARAYLADKRRTERGELAPEIFAGRWGAYLRGDSDGPTDPPAGEE